MDSKKILSTLSLLAVVAINAHAGNYVHRTTFHFSNSPTKNILMTIRLGYNSYDNCHYTSSTQRQLNNVHNGDDVVLTAQDFSTFHSSFPCAQVTYTVDGKQTQENYQMIFNDEGQYTGSKPSDGDVWFF